MAFVKAKKSEKSKATPRKSASAQVVHQQKAATAARSEKMTSAQLKEKELEKFLPENLQYLKEVFGIDLKANHIDAKVVADIAAGRVTDPIELILRPLAYDKDLKQNVEMPPIKGVASVKIVLPYERGTFKQVPHDDEHKVFFASYPCFDFLVKTDLSDVGNQISDVQEKQEAVRFTKEQIKALEGLGIREERLYPGSFNSISMEQKANMVKGLPFPVTGTVRISDGTEDSKIDVNINGMAQMKTNSKGEVFTKFEPQYPVESNRANVIDLLNIRKVGNVELDFFERTPQGKVKTDVYGSPIINKAGKQLISYGVAFSPVDGYVHKKVYDKQERKYEDKVEKVKYQVSVINGGLCINQMEKVNDLDKDGNQIMVTMGGKEVAKYHYEVKDTRIKDGKVMINGEWLEPVSMKDLDNYKRGIGGLFKDAKWIDYSEGKKNEQRYQAYAVPDNQKNGFAKSFSPTASKKIVEELEEKKTIKKKQNFSMGF